jgi:hypothetical protein
MTTSLRRYTAVAALAAIAALSTEATAQVGKTVTIIYPDIATEAELAALPNMTPQLAKWIVDNRPFTGMKAIDDHLKVSLDSAKRNALYGRMFLPTNLNVQVPAEIAVIPFAWRNMAHEFDEYKPFSGLAHWYREMDKYLDEPRLGTLQQYVFVPINANTGKDEDIMTIPGLQQPALDAIKRGRPWADQARFLAAAGPTLGAREAQRIARYLVFTTAPESRSGPGSREQR